MQKVNRKKTAGATVQLLQDSLIANKVSTGELVALDTIDKDVTCDPDGRVHRGMKTATGEMPTATKKLDEATAALRRAIAEIVQVEHECNDRSRKAMQSAKANANAMGEMLARVDKMVGPNFEKKLAQLEAFVSAAERLAGLEKTGMLDRLLLAFK